MYAIEVIDLVKKYDQITAVAGVNLHVKNGELFGLIGPDGAGKTTLLRSICTLLKPTSGKIKVAEKDVEQDFHDIRQILGYMPQRFSLYPDLTVEQNLHFFADLFQVSPEKREERLKRLFSFSRLEPFKNRRAAKLSGGMKQKLALSCALIHTPHILILDEPTYGVDPLSRQEFWDILQTIKQEGTTILLSTAYMEEAELCERIALMYKGKIITVGRPQEIRRQYPYPIYQVSGKSLSELRNYFSKQAMVQQIHLFGNSLHISFVKVPAESDWKTWQQETNYKIESWELHTPSIEDVFLNLMSTEEVL